jgi:hypothetical protein
MHIPSLKELSAPRKNVCVAFSRCYRLVALFSTTWFLHHGQAAGP